MNKFNVAFDAAQRHAVVLSADNENIPAGHEVIGSFESDIEPGTGRITGTGENTRGQNGEHIFISEARRILGENEVSDFATLTIEDGVSNQPLGADGELRDVKSTAEVERENAQEIKGEKDTGKTDDKPTDKKAAPKK